METCTYFPSLFDGVRNVKSSRTMDWPQVYELIHGGQLKVDTERHRHFRQQGMTKEADRTKHQSQAITPAVQCSDGRRDDQVVGYTGVSLVDLDHVPDLPATLDLLRNDPHTFMLYTTLSGQGIRIFFRYAYEGEMTKAVYTKCFLKGNEYFARLTGLPYDRACKNPSRLSALCHDEGAYFNPTAEPFTLPAEKQPPCTATPVTRGNYSQFSPNNSSADGLIDSKLIANIHRSIVRKGIKYVEGSRNQYISRFGYQLNRRGIPEQAAIDWAVKKFYDFDDDVAAIIRSCYNQVEEHGREKKKAAVPSRSRMATPEELGEFLNTQARFRYNEISGKTEIAMLKTAKKEAVPSSAISFVPITDRHLSTLWRRFNMENLHTTEEQIHSLIRSDFTPAYNPFKEYFESLPPWDGQTDYIAQLAGYVHTTTDPDHFAHCLCKWLVGMVAGFFDEKVTNQVVLVLIGPQGCGKTTFFEYMLPPQLYNYYSTKTNSNRLDKDDRLMLSEYALINFEELESMRTSEMNQLKAMITMRTVNERAPYGRYMEKRQRIASFCGTGNTTRFLNDPTGTRRWLPFEVTHIDDPRTYPFPYEGIYSQALHLLRSGFRYWFNREEMIRQASHNEKFEVPNPEEELIATYYRRPLLGEVVKFVTTSNIQERINSAIKKPLSLVKIATAMKKMEYPQVRKGSLRGFLVYEYSIDELRVNQSYKHTEGLDGR